MEYTLQRPIAFRGKTFETVTLSDYFKTRHKLALAENVKKSEELQHQCLLMSFCENMPRECFGDIYADDLDAIASHVNEVMSEYAESHGMVQVASAGKKEMAKPIIRPVIRPAR